jgi:nucleoid-associated protein YgaU
MVPVRERVGRWDPEPKDYVNYTTVFGDTLHSLSTKFFGTPDRYLDIYLANRQLIESPSEVPVNTEIRIPVME